MPEQYGITGTQSSYPQQTGLYMIPGKEPNHAGAF